MTAKSDELVNELVSASIAFGREREPDWQARIETARQELKAYVAELEAAQRWIPVSERLPEKDTDGNTLMAICRHSGEWVRAPFGAEFADEFVRHYSYWMYAPQPPEVQE